MPEEKKSKESKEKKKTEKNKTLAQRKNEEVKTLEKEEIRALVADFLKEYFEDIDHINDFNLNFIETNSLTEPKVNYIKLMRFIHTALNNLKSLDPEILDEFLMKVNKDMNNLYEYYQEFIKTTKIGKIIYKRDFLENIKPYLDLVEDVTRTEAQKNGYYGILKSTENEIKAMGQPKGDVAIRKYKGLKKRYVDAVSNYADAKDLLLKLNRALIKLEEDAADEFYSQFEYVRDYFITSLEKIINIKTFYLEKTLWFKAKQSQAIQNFFDRSQIKGDYSTKTFIQYYLKNINVGQSKSDGWHAYLQECLDEWSKDNE